jgi:V/A-type H+-transporting ATPase subunit C
MAYIRFVYPNAKYEAIGNPYIIPRELNNLIDTRELTSFIESLNQHKDYTMEGTTTEEIQTSLDKHLMDTLAMIQKDNTQKLTPFFELFIEKHDLAIIRHHIKARLMSYIPTPDYPTPYLPKTQTLIDQLAEEPKEALPDLLKSYTLPASLINQLTTETPDPLRIDSEFDKHLINRFLNMPLPYRCDSARNHYVKIWMDYLNINNILRAKQLNYTPDQIATLFLGDGQEIAAWKFKEMAETDQIPQIIQTLEGTSYFPKLKDAIEQYHTDRSTQPLEQALKQQYLDHLRNISLKFNQNLGPQLRFIASKEFEISNLKIIAKGLAEHISPDLIKPLLTTSEALT